MGLPTHRIEIRKHAFGHSWANDYLVECPTLDDAESVANILIAFEQNIHYTVVMFDSARISTTTKFDRVFRHVVINETGTPDAAGQQFLPLFNTLRLDMTTLDSDPCRKYYRIPIPESEQTDGNFAPGWISALDPQFPPVLAALPDGSSIVSNKGNIVINGSFHPLVQMRQLHRHKKKKVVPAP